MLHAHRLVRSDAEYSKGPMAATGDGRGRYHGEGDIQHDRKYSLRSVHFMGCVGISGSLAVASTGNSPRSANQLRCDRLPFSRQLRRLIALQGFSQGQGASGRYSWNLARSMVRVREEAHEHPKGYISLPLPPTSTPPNVADDKAAW